MQIGCKVNLQVSLAVQTSPHVDTCARRSRYRVAHCSPAVAAARTGSMGIVGFHRTCFWYTWLCAAGRPGTGRERAVARTALTAGPAAWFPGVWRLRRRSGTDAHGSARAGYRARPQVPGCAGRGGRVQSCRPGRLAQRESASFTPKRSLVRSQYRPPSISAAHGPSSEVAIVVCRTGSTAQSQRIVSKSPPDPSSRSGERCVYRFSVVEAFSWPITVTTSLTGTPRDTSQVAYECGDRGTAAHREPAHATSATASRSVDPDTS